MGNNHQCLRLPDCRVPWGDTATTLLKKCHQATVRSMTSRRQLWLIHLREKYNKLEQKHYCSIALPVAIPFDCGVLWSGDATRFTRYYKNSQCTRTATAQAQLQLKNSYCTKTALAVQFLGYCNNPRNCSARFAYIDKSTETIQK